MIALVSRPVDYKRYTDGSVVNSSEMDFVSRLFFMQVMHKTYAGTGAVCTGAAARIEGTIVHGVCGPRPPETKTIRIGHPSGTISIEVDVENTADGPDLKLAAFGRTSRRILEGFVYVPSHLFD
jgi:2-methylaconitate cis-trans-isomerase PrpF